MTAAAIVLELVDLEGWLKRLFSVNTGRANETKREVICWPVCLTWWEGRCPACSTEQAPSALAAALHTTHYKAWKRKHMHSLACFEKVTFKVCITWPRFRVTLQAHTVLPQIHRQRLKRNWKGFILLTYDLIKLTWVLMLDCIAGPRRGSKVWARVAVGTGKGGGASPRFRSCAKDCFLTCYVVVFLLKTTAISGKSPSVPGCQTSGAHFVFVGPSGEKLQPSLFPSGTGIVYHTQWRTNTTTKVADTQLIVCIYRKCLL